jgi:hypothetical protein
MKVKIIVFLLISVIVLMILQNSPWNVTKASQHTFLGDYTEPDPRISLDADGDGLYNFYEDEDGNGILAGDEISLTDPNNRDTDGDGFWDGEEYNYWMCRAGEQSYVPDWLIELHSNLTEEDEFYALYLPHGDLDGDGLRNILDQDSDNDGFADGKEIEQGTDPANKNISKVLYTDFII